MKLFLFPLAVLMTLAALSFPLSARADDGLDPFYQARLDEGKALYLRGDIPGSIQALEIASFGFLDHPEKRLEGSVYLLLGYRRTGDAAGESRCRGEIERLNARIPLSSLDLPPAVRAALEEITAGRPKEAAPKGPVEKRPPPALREETDGDGPGDPGECGSTDDAIGQVPRDRLARPIEDDA